MKNTPMNTLNAAELLESHEETKLVTKIPGSGLHHLRILQAIRRIIRAVELHSKKLAVKHNITGPQLICLIKIKEDGPITCSALARLVHLSPSTIVGILDRLEEKSLIFRQRDNKDRRLVYIQATEKGKKVVLDAPSPLQDKLAESLNALPELEHITIAMALEKVVDLMEAQNINASPMLKTGNIDQPVEDLLNDTVKE